MADVSPSLPGQSLPGESLPSESLPKKSLPGEARAFLGSIKRGLAWGRRIDREAALDSARSVFALIGVGAVVAYLGTMPPYLVPLAVVIVAGAWYADYRRHF